MVPPAGLEPASLSCLMGGTVGLGIRPTDSHRLRSTNSGSAAGRGKVPAGAWQAYLQSCGPLLAALRGHAFTECATSGSSKGELFLRLRALPASAFVNHGTRSSLGLLGWPMEIAYVMPPKAFDQGIALPAVRTAKRPGTLQYGVGHRPLSPFGHEAFGYRSLPDTKANTQWVRSPGMSSVLHQGGI